MYISKIVLEDIRCFEKLEVDLTVGGFPVLFCGDNGNGKSTVLRCIAMGLCDVSSAAALFRELLGDFIRKGKEDKGGTITLYLQGNDRVEFKIKTTIKYLEAFEVVEQDLRKKEPGKRWRNIESAKFPWEQIFVTAYGPGIRILGTADYQHYLAVDAVYPLFRHDAHLQNPELAFRRIVDEAEQAGGSNLRKRHENAQAMKSYLCQLLRHVLNLEADAGDVDITSTGFVLKSHWGVIELGGVGDGHRATTTWVLDLLSWWLLYLKLEKDKNIFENRDISGIVLIDEVEQHLHPSWQRSIIRLLHELFPNIQFITTTHSPLVTGGTADIDNSAIVALRHLGEEGVGKEIIRSSLLKGMRADQVLRSDAFGLVATASPGSVKDIVRYGELLSMKSLGAQEREELKQLRRSLKEKYTFGDTSFEEIVEKAVLCTLSKMLREKPTEVHKLEAKRQLGRIFRRDGRE